jgi:hypothetical protein
MVLHQGWKWKIGRNGYCRFHDDFSEKLIVEGVSHAMMGNEEFPNENETICGSRLVSGLFFVPVRR